MDPRTTLDGLPILELLTSAQFLPPGARISRESREALQLLEFTDEPEILGPRFDCPTCRMTLLAAPARSFLIDGVLSTLPVEKTSGEPASSDGTTSGGGQPDKGKGKEKSVDWSRFFGSGLGHGAEGYDALEMDA